MKELTRIALLLILSLGLLLACEEDEPTPDPGTDPDPQPSNAAPELTQKINRFMLESMQDVYFWNNQIPNIDYRLEHDSHEYFKKLLSEDDKWSYATDDVQALENSFEGIEKTYGWSLAFGRFSNTDNVFALVEFVYPNTPATEAGIKRGDIIVLMNGADITINNYRDLLYGESMNINLGVLTAENTIAVENQSIALSARELNLNPVIKSTIVEHDGKKIGYLLYAQYIPNYNTSLDAAFQNMVDNNVRDVVIDLRYNPGGSVSAATHLSSCIAPLDVVNRNSILVKYFWNSRYQKYWVDNQIMHQLEEYFDKDVPVKMGLDKIHFLVGPGTASASELTITGLRAYMPNVTLVGETTHGKYTASITLKPGDIYEDSNYYKDFDNWAIQPIVIRYANSVGVTDFKDGFMPDIEVADDLFAGIPLGTKEEPLFKAAIEDITGTEVVAMKSAKPDLTNFRIFDRGFSKYDRNKRELLIDNHSFKRIK